MIVFGGFLILICGIGLAVIGHVAVGAIVALLGVAAMLLGAHGRMQ